MKIRNFVLGVIALLSVSLIVILEFYESNWWGQLYNIGFCGLLFILILVFTKKPTFSVASTSFIFSSIWLISEIKFQYLGMRLVPQDLYTIFSSKEILSEMAFLETSIFISAIIGLGYLFYKENA